MNFSVAEAVQILDYPPEFVSELIRRSEAEFELACYLIRTSYPADESPRILSALAAAPRELSLGFKLWLRLHFWERTGIWAHTKAGMPSSADLLSRFAQWQDAGFSGFVRENPVMSIHILYEHTLWLRNDGDKQLSAEFELWCSFDDNELLDAVAELLLNISPK